MPIASALEEIFLGGTYRLKTLEVGRSLSFENSIILFIGDGDTTAIDPFPVDFISEIDGFGTNGLAALYLLKASKLCGQRGIPAPEFAPEWISSRVLATRRHRQENGAIPLKADFPK